MLFVISSCEICAEYLHNLAISNNSFTAQTSTYAALRSLQIKMHPKIAKKNNLETPLLPGEESELKSTSDELQG